MSDEEQNPVTTPEWEELRADTDGVATEYRENGWDAVVLDPSEVVPVGDGNRSGLEVTVDSDEYDRVGGLLEREDVTFAGAEVYYRPSEGKDRRYALVIERDEDSESAVFVPLTYALSETAGVFERALGEGSLHVYIRPDGDERSIAFSHDEPSLFLEESDFEEWRG
jgi:hypothetical protein